MSHSYNFWFTQTHIPCNHPSEDQHAENGTAQINIDGKAVRGGTKVNGVCHAGGMATASRGYHNANNDNLIFHIGGGVVPYTNGYATANNVNAVRSLRASHL